ncbi:MAG: hydroxyphenylacetyl-CoA thioesterase PaaI [Acidibrevibacterium sp.]|uniref:hydroxyphenylacetyl-CoA thioesterase PaaI n=1 Tax=Acidibrevibacterium sp. TaxID=2606776 RepID=UPI003D05447F
MTRADALARACAEAMWRDDQASRALGMEILAVAPGEARLAMTIRAEMVNGHGTCHGGFIFLLADSAFAFACNSENEKALAQHCAITFLRPARRGERLEAEAVKRSDAGRSGIYDVTVRTSDGTVIAEFRGQSRRIGERFFPEEATDATP